jgi:hypothetical protein
LNFSEFVPEHGHERVHIDVAVELLVIAKAVVLIALGKTKTKSQKSGA